MKVFVYKNGMCDPRAKLGTIKMMNKAKDVDDYINTLCASMTPVAHRQFRLFIANDEVPQEKIDHWILMEDNYGLDIETKNFKEVDTLQVASACDEKVRAREKIIRPRTQILKG
jgi:hypothetical protein